MFLSWGSLDQIPHPKQENANNKVLKDSEEGLGKSLLSIDPVPNKKTINQKIDRSKPTDPKKCQKRTTDKSNINKGKIHNTPKNFDKKLSNFKL